MKGKKFLMILIMLLITLEVFSKENLSWGMTSKKLKKKTTIEKKYENDFCEILLLSKGSIYENDYDEYLLFSKNAGLIAKLHNTNQEYENFIKAIENNYSGSGYMCYGYMSQKVRPEEHLRANEYYKDILSYCNQFPSENSFEIICLLYGLSDYTTNWYINENESRYNKSQSIIVNNNGIAFQMEIYYSHETNTTYIDEDYVYSNFQEYNASKINIILSNFENYIKNEKKKEYDQRKTEFEHIYSKNPGPFGIAWGMNSNDIPFIGDIEYNKTGGGFDIDEYNKYYFYEKEYLNFHLIKPHKSNDKIQNYTGIFDNNQNLIQLVCVNYATHAAGVKNLATQENETNLNYEEMKKTISNIYGDGKEIKSRGEKCLQWQDSAGQKIELVQNSYIMKDYYGREGLVKYIWLVYSSPKYDSDIEEIKNAIDEKNLKKQQEKQEKEKIQNSYF